MSETTAADQAHILNNIRDTELDVSVVLMEKASTIGDLSALNPGSVLSFDLPADSPALLTVNGKTVATGAVVQVNDNFGIKVDSIND